MANIKRADLKKLIKEALESSQYDIMIEKPELLDEKSILKNKHPFKAVYMFGPAGSGKGYVLKNVLVGGNGADIKPLLKDFATANPDDRIEEVFPAFGISMKFANQSEGGDAELEQLQQKSREILQNAARAHTANLISIANPIIFDTTGEKVPKLAGRITAMTRLGYDVAVMMINVPKEASVERDAQRDRTVGAERTSAISDKYQAAVVAHRGYYDALAGLEHVTMLVDDVYNNIFDLSTGELLQKPTAITPEMLPDKLNPEKNPEAFATEKAKMAQAVNRLAAWVATPVANPAGQTVLKGMRRLVKLSKGVLGQNLNDLPLAVLKPEFQQDPEIAAAAEYLGKLGGTSMEFDKDTGETERGDSQDSPAVAGAIRNRKKRDNDDSIRQMTQKESFDYNDLVELINELITTKNSEL